MKSYKNLITPGLVALLLTTGHLFSAPFQSDNFSGTTIDGSKWSGPWVNGNGTLTQNNALFYHNDGSGTDDDEAELDSQGVGSVTSDWSVWMDVQIPNLSQVNTDGQSVSFRLDVWDNNNPDVNHFDLEMYVQQRAGFGKWRHVSIDLYPDTFPPVGAHSAVLDLSGQPVISMGVSWQASSKTLSVLWAPNGGGANWIVLQTWNVGPGSPTAWNLDPALGFGLYISGGSANNVNLQTSDNVRITNFTVANAIITGRMPPTITTGIYGTFNPLPTATLGNGYSQTLQASGGVLPYTWSVIMLSLPPGLTMAPNGTISGTPTSLGTWQFRARVMGADAAYSEKNYSITVANPPPQISGLALSGKNVILQIPSVVGSAYQLQFTASLTPTNWVNTGASQPGSGGVLSFTDTGGATNRPSRFYRADVSTP